jgi:hypothetical protein
MRRSFPVLGLAALALTLSGCGGPPRIGPEKDAMKTVDALYTAVSLRDETLVDDSLARLRTLRERGKLPDRAFRSLQAIALDAKGGAWEPSQDRLIRFMDRQTR